MTKELQEFKERCLGLSCSPYSDNFSCEDCPLNNGKDCELNKFESLILERFKPKPEICPTCGKENE